MPNVPDYIKIIGIDPGTTNIGYSVIRFSALTGEIVDTRARTIVAGKEVSLDKLAALVHGERFARIHSLCHTLLRMFHEDTPNFVVCEAPFYNPKRPSAYGALVEIMDGIRNTVHLYHPFMQLEPIDPSSAKNAVGASGGAKKEVMQKAIMTMTDLRYVGDIPQSHLDEHSIDAIAVAYSKYKKCLACFLPLNQPGAV